MELNTKEVSKYLFVVASMQQQMSSRQAKRQMAPNDVMSANKHCEAVFKFISAIEQMVGKKVTIVNQDVNENPQRQLNAFQELCKTLRFRHYRQLHPNDDHVGETYTIAMTTLPMDDRDGLRVPGVSKEWIYLPTHDVMFYVLSNGRHKVTGNPETISQLVAKVKGINMASS